MTYTHHKSPALEAAAQLSDAALSLAHVAAICSDAFDGAYITVDQTFIESHIYIDVATRDHLVLATDRLHDADMITTYRQQFGWSSGVATLRIDDTTIHIGVRGKVA